MTTMPTSVELFAGGGGLLLGSALAGARHLAAVEWNTWAAQTMRANAAEGYPLVDGLQVIEGDVRAVDWASVTGGQDVDLVTGGPPCQPFSAGGLGRAAEDPRDMFPAAADVLSELRPRAFVFENVRGLTRPAFADYLEHIKLRLQHPDIKPHAGESWTDHHARLAREHRAAGAGHLRYRLTTHLVDAADYGVPQRRHRVFFVGWRDDMAGDWGFPAPTHSAAALAHAQAGGDYWEARGVPAAQRDPIRRTPAEDGLAPWRTVRDALTGMPTPTRAGSPGWLDHRLQHGARAYPGHTGSPLDEPAKALKAGVHGVPGGENMLRRADGSVRYFTVRESARIQTFPDRYALHGAWGEAMRQLGNAVPVLLAQQVVGSVVGHLHLDQALATAPALELAS